MSRYKKLQSIIIYDDDDLEGLKEGSVIFNKEGWYLDRPNQICWYEIETSTGIRAFESEVKAFNWSLQLALHKPLTNKEVVAVKTVLKIAKNKSLSTLHYIDHHWKQLRDARRETRMFMNRGRVFSELMIISKELDEAIRYELPIGWSMRLSHNIIALMAIDLGYIKINIKTERVERNYEILGKRVRLIKGKWSWQK